MTGDFIFCVTASNIKAVLIEVPRGTKTRVQ